MVHRLIIAKQYQKALTPDSRCFELVKITLFKFRKLSCYVNWNITIIIRYIIRIITRLVFRGYRKTPGASSGVFRQSKMQFVSK